MTLFINGRFLTQPLSGVQRYAHELVRALDNHLAKHPSVKARFGQVVVLTPFASGTQRKNLPRYRSIEVFPTGASQGHVWEQSRLYQISKDGVLLSLGNCGPLAHEAHVVAFHDAHVFEMPEAFSPGYRRWHRFLRPRLAQRAKGLITVSQHSAQTLAHWLDVDTDRFAIVPNSAEHVLRIEENLQATEEHGLNPKRYLLSVGNQSPNKNLIRLIEAHRDAGSDVPPLAIVGDAPRALNIAKLETQNGLYVLGRVSDADLRGLYKGALGFVFPSLNEGFGIPPLEAMQLGVPVLSSNATAMPEVLGNAPMWFDPRDQLGMTLALKRFAAMAEEERKIRITKGLARAGRYSWRASAEALVEMLGPMFAAGARPVRNPRLRKLISAR
ncbi:glycosyltransferase family 4 protein [Roseovarius rhodophyticola]|uniref:Glycosyltransferase family 1 protein n=1 Tax=Roseovarius rhodophyticola TaxID=3080827 RepID=A0ABZ2TNY4_9RHOB|nr:glycosyltransferase family 1 protein [Roseovarius sp. W115]MDV2930218.1 glycosyltransferase family 1 protein [Roseovarius sp. W115]